MTNTMNLTAPLSAYLQKTTCSFNHALLRGKLVGDKRADLKLVGSTSYSSPLLLSAMLSASLLSAPAFATTELALQLATSLTGDSNPLRFYDGDAAAAQNGNPSTSDKVKALDVRAGLIIPILSDRTRLILTGSLGTRQYQTYQDLDHQEKAADASFEYAVGDLLAGRVIAGKEDRLFQYINGSLTAKDISHFSQTGAELTLKITDELSVPVKLDRSNLHYDLDVNQLYNFHQNGQQAGLKYYSPTGSNLELGVRFSDTDYPNRNPQQIADLDQRYRETETYLEAEWKYSVKTVVSTHLGLIRRRYDSLSDLNTNLLSTLVRGTYFYSPKLRIDAQIFDRPFAIVDPSILYVVTKGLRLDAQWNMSDKTQFHLTGLAQNSDQKLVPRLAEIQDSVSRKEKLTRAGFGINYQLQRGFRLMLDSFYEKVERDTNLPGLKQGVIMIGLEYSYENLPGSAAKMGLSRYQHSLNNTDALR